MAADNNLARWQRALLPLMSSMLVVGAIYFAFVTLSEFDQLQIRLQRVPPPELATVWAKADAGAVTLADQIQVARDRSRFELERDIVARRYEATTASLVASVWTRFMGFVTGMVLALVGAAFVLGKLQEEQASKGAAALGGVRISLRSTSPGVVLAGLGVALMGASILTQSSYDIEDRPVYLGAEKADQTAADAMPGLAKGGLADPHADPFAPAETQDRKKPGRKEKSP